MSKSFITMAAAAILATGLCVAGLAENKGVTDTEIVIGTCNALSGPSEFGGKETNVGIKTYMSQVNAEGGINGRIVKVISEDDRYEPDAAIGVFQKMMQNGAFGITGAYGSTCLARYIPLCEKNKVPCVGNYAGTHFVGDPVRHWIFNARAPYKDEEHELIDKLWACGFRRFAVIYQNDPYGVDHLNSVKEGLKKHNAEIVGAGAYIRNSNNLGEAFAAVKATNPEVVILGAVYTPCSQVVKMARDVDWHPLFAINSGSSEEAFIREAGKNADGCLVTEVVPFCNQTNLPLISKYLKALKQYAPGETAGSCSLRGYIDALVWAEGLKRTGKDVTREKFVDALESIHHRNVGLGSGMELNYSPTDHLGFHKIFFGQVKNGQVNSFADWNKLKVKASG